ncbi:hypothetical protein N9Z01_07755 [Flavobacteriaceae bacterium]|nr:hypothetical protein [Flavobacteriaceae bacterium]
MLNSNTVVNQSISITNRAQLLLAKSLIGTETTDPLVIVNGFVKVTINGSNFTADEIARVNAITSKIATVLEYVEASSTATPIDFANLNFIDGNYTVIGKDANDPKLATLSGDLITEHYGAADYSQITSVGGNVTVHKEVSSLNLSGATIAGNVNSDGSTAGIIILPKAVSVNVGTAQVYTVSLTLAEGVVNLGYDKTIGYNVLIEAPKAASIEFAAKTVTGTLMVSAKGDATILNAPNLTTVSATTITADTTNFPKLVEFTGDSVITADTVTFPELTKNVSGTLSFPTADSFVAPKLTITSNITATKAESVAFLSGSHMNLIAPDVETLTIHGQGNTTDFNTIGYTKLETFNFTGVVGTKAPLINTVTNIIDIQGTKLKNVTIAGMADSVVVSNTGELVGLTTEGQIRNFTVYNADKLASVSIGHAHTEGSDAAMFTIQDNKVLAGLTTTNLDETGNITIKDNPALASLDLSSLKTIPLMGLFNIAISDNKLTGTYTAATAGSTTTAAVKESLTSAALATIKPYLKLAVASRASASIGNVTYTLAINLSNVAATGTTSLTAALAADTTRTETATNPLTDTYLVSILND